MRNLFMPNKYDQPCVLCGKTVNANEGQLFARQGRRIGWGKTNHPEFVAQHKKCSKGKSNDK